MLDFRRPVIHKTRNGFTLVELSMVLVIIGFIVGGVLVGADVIDRAQKQAMISDLETFNTSIVSFNKKFLGIPGDLSNGTYYFPATCGGGTNCNGNGNNVIDFTGGTNEDYEAWEHLVLSQLVPGNYSYTTPLTLGTNIPAARKPGTGYWLYNQVQIAVGSSRGGAANYMDGGAFTADEARYVDNKIDDGQPGSGILQVRRDQSNPNSAICITQAYNSANISSATYIMTDKTNSCFLIYVTSIGALTVTYPAH